MLRLKTNLKAGDTGCYRNHGMRDGTYWCYATDPGEAVSCLQHRTKVNGTNPGRVGSPTDRVMSVCSGGSCMDNGNSAYTRIQCSPV